MLTEYLLSDRVLRFQASGYSIPFPVVLAYEFALRRRMCDHVRGRPDLDLVEAPRLVIADAELREQHFITPFLASLTRAPAAPGFTPNGLAPLTPARCPPTPSALVTPPPPPAVFGGYHPYSQGGNGGKRGTKEAAKAVHIGRGADT